MMLRRAFVAGGVGSLATARPASAESPGPWTLRPIEHPAFNWRLVAQSDLIVRGILAIPAETAAALKQDSGRYVPVRLAVSRVYKGSERRDALDLQYVKRDGCGPAPDALAALKARDAVFYLTPGKSPGAKPDYYLVECAAETATAVSATHEQALRQEIETQVAMARRVAGLLAERQPPFEDSVAAALRAALAGDNQSALRGLRRSGLAAAAAMIRHLGDRRKLPTKAISVVIDGAFEGLSHYSVGEVGDLLMFALSLVAKDVDFGWPSPETPDGPRQRIADAWRVWLGYSLELGARG